MFFRIVNLDMLVGFTTTATVLGNMANVYKHVVDSYFRHVTEALAKSEFALLFEKKCNKNPAFTYFLQALKINK